ncbi:MAG: phosphoribosylformimino-5-aminoimidazole carboxamide ribotide isomerase [Lachnospiraceae bacterium]|nr:phosphoribosylformimino-5-aminoimidazole carboxamide ribotide isomerase [Lachnospiraceae bacterium]
MRFRPCIDIHNGKVKQIVGGSLKDQGDLARENFVSEKDAGFYADFYKTDGLQGGHIILLNPAASPYYEATRQQAVLALSRDPGHLQVGGGICPENAEAFLRAGASHVIVTSYVFRDGQIKRENLEHMRSAVGREHLVLDLSCRKKDGKYYIVTDRWQKFTEVSLNREVMNELAGFCDEFLIHAVDVEGKAGGPELELVRLLGEWEGLPVTYAGGIRDLKDLELLARYGRNRLDVTVGSALDLFGGSLPYRSVLDFCKKFTRN